MWQHSSMTGNGHIYGMTMENPSPGGKSLHQINIWTGQRYLQNSNAYPTFSAMSNQIVPVPMFPDVGRWLKQCWRAHLQVEKSLHWAHIRTELRYHRGNSKAYMTFLTMPGPVEHVLMFPNVGWWPYTVFVLETQLQVENRFIGVGQLVWLPPPPSPLSSNVTILR